MTADAYELRLRIEETLSVLEAAGDKLAEAVLDDQRTIAATWATQWKIIHAELRRLRRDAKLEIVA